MASSYVLYLVIIVHQGLCFGLFDPDTNDYDAYGLKIAVNNVLLVESLPDANKFLIVLAPFDRMKVEQQCFFKYDETHYVYSVGVGSESDNSNFYAIGQITNPGQQNIDPNVGNSTFIVFYHDINGKNCSNIWETEIEYVDLTYQEFLVLVVHPTGDFALGIAKDFVFKFDPFAASRITVNTSFWPDQSFTPRVADISANFTIVAGLIDNGVLSRVRASLIVYLIDNNLITIYSNWTYVPPDDDWRSDLTFSGTTDWSLKYTMSVDINNFDPTRVLIGVPYLNTVFHLTINGSEKILTLSGQTNEKNNVGFGKGVAWLTSAQAAILSNKYTSTFSSWLSSQIWIYTQLPTTGLSGIPTAIIPNSQQPLPPTVQNQFLNIISTSSSLAILDVTGSILLILSVDPGFYASTNSNLSPDSISIPTISTKQSCLAGMMKNDRGIHPCSLCPSGSRSTIGSVNCTICNSSAFCPLGAVADLPQSALEPLSQAYAYRTSPDLTSFDDILLAFAAQLKPIGRCLVVSPVFWTLIASVPLVIFVSIIVILQHYRRKSENNNYIKTAKKIAMSADIVTQGEVWLGGLATIILVVFVSQAYVFSTKFVEQYPAEQAGDSDFACDTSLRNAQFETSLQSLAVPPNEEEQVMFDLLNNQEWTMNVNFLNTEVTCSSISCNQIAGNALVPIALVACSKNGSIVKSSIKLSHQAEIIQFTINDIKPIGGISLGMTGPRNASGSSTLKDLEFSQAFHDATRTLSQTTTLSLQLTKAINKTEPLSGSDPDFSGIWYPKYTVDKNSIFITRETYITSSNSTQTIVALFISENSYYIKHTQKPIVKRSEMIFKNFMFTLFCIEILAIPLILSKLMIKPVWKYIRNRTKAFRSNDNRMRTHGDDVGEAKVHYITQSPDYLADTSNLSGGQQQCVLTHERHFYPPGDTANDFSFQTSLRDPVARPDDPFTVVIWP